MLVAACGERIGQFLRVPAAARPEDRDGQPQNERSRTSTLTLPASASRDYGEPFGAVLEQANWDFYEIDPLLFSPAQVRLTSVGSGRSFEAGRVNVEVLERSFWG